MPASRSTRRRRSKRYSRRYSVRSTRPTRTSRYRTPARSAALAAAFPSRPEVKTWDGQFGAGSIPHHLVTVANVTGGDFSMDTGMTCLNLVPSGTGFWNRIGSKISMSSLELSMSFQTVAGKPSAIRWMLVYDKQPNAAYPLIDDLLRDNNAINASFHSTIRNASLHRFLVLRDQTTYLCDSHLGITYHDQIPLRHVSNYVGVETDTNQSIVDLTYGALHVLAFTNVADNTGPLITAISSRLTYID